ncbi:hypothetical protein LZ009_14985 [Ramlibacter sp. XY19]|uniref:hypothetical protein n=1 Tax=Ramlibacter paludis TaxID=2908000 RepID=UPI0023DC9A8B|nr:hypothetical protein [Ramlibacter paludis]MCG2594084.1 hypothetical protein [Ramlibacter paludis]
MGIFGRIMGKGEPSKPAGSSRSGSNSKSPVNSTQFAPSQAANSRDPATSVHAVRKEVLKLVMRETLNRNGIPENWLSADLLRTNSARREQGIHVRLLLRHWDPRLMQHGVALEQEFYKRLLALDPTAPNWLMGFSWQFAMEDLSACPPLPHPGSWTAPTQAQAGDDRPTTRAGDIIEGPVMIPQTQDEVRADLERLLALRDEDMKQHGDGFAPTRPVQL